MNEAIAARRIITEPNDRFGVNLGPEQRVTLSQMMAKSPMTWSSMPPPLALIVGKADVVPLNELQLPLQLVISRAAVPVPAMVRARHILKSITGELPDETVTVRLGELFKEQQVTSIPNVITDCEVSSYELHISTWSSPGYANTPSGRGPSRYPY